MTINELFEEEKNWDKGILFEKKLTRAQRKSTAIDPNARFELGPNIKQLQRNHKHLDWKDHDPKFRPGRERLVAAVRNLAKKRGVGVSTSRVRDYIYEMFNKYKEGDSDADWIQRLAKKARQLGFNPDEYLDQKRGDSIGMGAKGDPEYDGRAFFFTGVMNGFANHFVYENAKKGPKSKSSKEINKMAFKQKKISKNGGKK